MEAVATSCDQDSTIGICVTIDTVATEPSFRLTRSSALYRGMSPYFYRDFLILEDVGDEPFVAFLSLFRELVRRVGSLGVGS